MARQSRIEPRSPSRIIHRKSELPDDLDFNEIEDADDSKSKNSDNISLSLT
jgi:hypothetical protein